MIGSCIGCLARLVDDLQLGDAREIGHAERRLYGQVLGTVIPHACGSASAPRSLPIAMIEAPFFALPVPAMRRPLAPAPPAVATLRPAVYVPAGAPPADRKERAAERAERNPLIGHDLACADFLPGRLDSGEGASVDATSLDPEGWELPLLAFALSARRICRIRLARGQEISCDRTCGPGSYGSEWAFTASSGSASSPPPHAHFRDRSR